MADLTLNISQYSPLQQFTVRPWETFSPDDQLIITDKINLIVQTLNRLGKLSNDVVTDWNKVMTWVSNDGMTAEVDSQLQKWKDDGTLTTLINAYTGIGDLTTLQTVAKDSLVHAINENVTNIATKANQADLYTTNANVSTNTTNINNNTNSIGTLAQLNTTDKSSVVNAIKEVKTQSTNNQTSISNIGNASPKGSYATLSALQTAFPTGTTGIYVVTADGNWYYWNGSAWTVGGVYQSTGIAAKSITSAMIAPITTYSIIYGNVTTKPNIRKDSSGNFIITFPTSTTTMYLLDDKGVQLQSLVVTNLTYTIATNQMLVWNVDTNAIVVIGNNAARDTRNVVLLSNYYGSVQNGYFRPLWDKYELSGFSIIIGTGGTYPTFSTSGLNITVIMPTGTLYLLDKTGLQIQSLNVNGLSFTLGNQMLVWNVDDNQILVMGNNDIRNTRSVILLSNNYGTAQNGYFKPWFDDYVLNVSINKVNVGSTTTIMKKIAQVSSSVFATQGLTIINNEIWGFNGSADDHSNTGSIQRYDVDTLQPKTNFTHNLGHAANADYDTLNDHLLVSNGTTDTTILPRIDIVKNASTLLGNNAQSITYGASNVLSIPFFTANKQIGGNGLVSCFGESFDTLYLLTASPNKIFKCMLGTGTNDYSDKTSGGTDTTLWGTFIPGVSANEFNGTAKIVASYTGDSIDTYQGVIYHNGYLYLATGNSGSSSLPIIVKIKCLDNGIYSVQEKNQIPPSIYNGIANKELEGICLYKGMYLLSSLMGCGTYVIPLYNKQSGKATSGTRVTLPFPCNSTPNIIITPTSNVIDLYISSSDNKGFTVSSISGGVGSFNWECMIG